jgi:hypothetical protein
VVIDYTVAVGRWDGGFSVCKGKVREGIGMAWKDTKGREGVGL